MLQLHSPEEMVVDKEKFKAIGIRQRSTNRERTKWQIKDFNY